MRSSGGKPNERGIVQDGIAAVDWLVEHTRKDPDQLVYMGRSLGGGVCIQVAESRKPRALVLVSTFSSMVDVASESWWWLPVGLVMRNRYESSKFIRELDVPLFQIHGDRDRIISINNGRQLFEASVSGDKQFLIDEGKGHNNIDLNDWTGSILGFLDGR